MSSVVARVGAPWLAVAAVGVVLAVVGTFIMLDRGSSVQPATPSASTPLPVGDTNGDLVDLSTMTREEAAERLFNRIMTASENGDQAEAENFVPMALQAYDLLSHLGSDEHYHVGLLHMVVGDVDGARTQQNAIRQSTPEHLMGFMLAHAIAEASDDDDGAATAYSEFLDAYDKEMTFDRREYTDHQVAIASFRERAEASKG